MLRSKFGVERKGIIDEFGAIFEAERCWSAQSSSAVPGKAWFCYNISRVFRTGMTSGGEIEVTRAFSRGSETKKGATGNSGAKKVFSIFSIAASIGIPTAPFGFTSMSAKRYLSSATLPGF